MSEKLLAIFFSLMILGQAWAVRRFVGTWIFPASILGLFWFGYTFIPLVLLFPVPIEPMAVAYILLGCLIFSASLLVFKWRGIYPVDIRHEPGERYDSRFLRLVFYALGLVAVACVVVNWSLQGFTAREIIFDFYQTAVKYITIRARGEVSKNIVSQLGVVLTYPAAVLGGLVYASRRKGEAGIGVLGVAFLPSVLSMLVEGNKGMLFLAAALFWGGVLVSQISRGEVNILDQSSLAKIALISIGLLGLIWFAFVARIGNEDLDTQQETEKMIMYFLSYGAGHLYAFSDWFSWVIGKPSVMTYSDAFDSGGFYTFMGLFRLLGDSRSVQPGVYGEYFVYQNLLHSNIYTIFRGLVLDFGLVGAMVFWGLLGLLSHAMFRLFAVGKWRAFTGAYFIHLIGFFYTSFIISLLIWNSVFASFVITAMVLWVNQWVSARRVKWLL